MGIRSNLKRVDVWDKVTGRAKYTEDLIPHNTLVAKILHSTIANGVVRKIDVSEAASTKGVIGVFTCFDTPMLPYATAGHPPSIDPKHPNVSNKIMLSQRVRYYGDDIAVVVAEDEIIAVRALQKIKVEYEEWKPYKDAKEAVSSEHP